jgi:hypothetical protein
MASVVTGAALVGATDVAAGAGRSAERLRRRVGTVGATIPAAIAAVTHRTPGSDEISAVVLRSDTGPPCVLAVAMVTVAVPGPPRDYPVLVERPLPGIWFGARASDMSTGRTGDVTRTSGALVCGFDAATAGLSSTVLCVTFGTGSEFFVLEVWGTAQNAVHLTQCPAGELGPSVALSLDAPGPRAPTYTVAWRIGDGTVTVHAWYGVVGQAARMHLTGEATVRPGMVPYTDTVTIGGTCTYLYQYVWDADVKSAAAVLADGAALDRMWSGTG